MSFPLSFHYPHISCTYMYIVVYIYISTCIRVYICPYIYIIIIYMYISLHIITYLHDFCRDVNAAASARRFMAASKRFWSAWGSPRNQNILTIDWEIKMYWHVLNYLFLLFFDACFVHHIASKRQKPILQKITVKWMTEASDIWAISVVYCGVESKASPRLQMQHQHQPALGLMHQAVPSMWPGTCDSDWWCPNNSKWPHVASILVILYTQQKGLWPNT